MTEEEVLEQRPQPQHRRWYLGHPFKIEAASENPAGAMTEHRPQPQHRLCFLSHLFKTEAASENPSVLEHRLHLQHRRWYLGHPLKIEADSAWMEKHRPHQLSTHHSLELVVACMDKQAVISPKNRTLTLPLGDAGAMTEHRRYSSEPPDIEEEAAWMVEHRQQQPQHSSHPLEIEAASTWMEYSSHPLAIEASWMEKEQAIEAAWVEVEENLSLTLQGISTSTMKLRPQTEKLTLEEEEKQRSLEQPAEGLEEVEAATSTMVMMMTTTTTTEVSLPETPKAAAKLLWKAQSDLRRAQAKYRGFHYAFGRQFKQQLRSFLDIYLYHYHNALYFAKTQDPKAMSAELKGSLGKLEKLKALLENSVEEYRNRYLAQMEDIRSLTLEAAQLERIITDECSLDDKKGSWLNLVITAVNAFSTAAVALYAFNRLSSPSTH